MRLSTIGFTQTSAEHFFRRLKDAEVRRLIDVRLNNTSQLAGFAKAKDLAYFLREIVSAEYQHEPMLAPTPDILDAYKKGAGSWSEYERKFLDLMDRRRIDERLEPSIFEDSCLLCSEAKPHHCHRRLIAEFLNDRWDVGLTVRHL
jgi:uncharacterized protein (DUF488 family)